MRLLVDGTPLHSGGGVQVAVGLLQGLAGTQLDWRAVLPEPVAAQLPRDLRTHPAITCVPKQNRADLLRLARACREIEAATRPSLVFTVFGPGYFKARAPHLVGFALPNMVYPPAPGLPARGVAGRLGDHVRRHLLRRADHLVVETHSFADRTAAATGFDRRRIHVVRNAVNPLLESYQRTAPPDGGFVHILVPSAHYPHKNLEAVPRVAAALAQGWPEIDFKFQLTLDPASPGWCAIAAAATDLGVAARVETLGVLPLPELAQAYQKCGLVFLPTLREASTAVYPEAFHFGRPLITTEIDFARELCGDAAVFVDPYRAGDMAAAIAGLLADPARRDSLIAAGIIQLGRGYPSAADKFAAQLRLFEDLAMR